MRSGLRAAAVCSWLAVICFAAAFAEPPDTVVEIQIDGSGAVSADELRRAVSAHTEDPQEAARAVLERYQAAGRLFAEAEAAVERLPDGTRVLRIRAREGPQARLQSIEWVGLNALTEEDAAQALGVRIGALLHAIDWRSALDKLARRYADNGRPYASALTEIVRADPQTGEAHLRVKIEEGVEARIESVQFEGLKKTRLQTALRLLPVRAGDLYDQRKIDDARHILLNCGYFASVHPALIERVGERGGERSGEMGGRDGLIRFRARVEEAPTFRAVGLLGYAPPLSEEDAPQLIGAVEASDANLFGTGRQARFRWEAGDDRSTQAAYREPFLFHSGVDLEARWDAERVQGGYREAGSLRVGWTPAPRLRASAGGQRLRADGLTGSGLLAEAVWDARDSRDNPTTGWHAAVRADAVVGGARFQRVEASVRRVLPIARRHAAAFKAQIGAVFGSAVPPAERFRMGGADTLRGHRERAFEGEVRRLGSIEYRLLTGPRSRLFAFFDIGRMDRNKTQYGYGVGANLESKTGLAQIQYGVSPDAPLLEGIVHLRLGAAFR